ncbi:MAG: TIR domain-containing protein [Candidatus Binatia bacterium]
MPQLKSRNLFISHSWSYADEYDRLLDLLNAAPNFQYKNYSVPKNDPVHNAPNTAALERAIENQMRFCDVVLIMAGKYATFSEWIQREIHIAKGYTWVKPIVAIRPWASQQVSTVVSNAADRLVSWSTSSIVSAIRELDP